MTLRGKASRAPLENDANHVTSLSAQQVESGGTRFSDLSTAKYIVLETYRKNGNPVRTPVWFVEDNGSVYVRTGAKSGKVKRLRRNPSLKLAPSNGRGNPKGQWIDATASFASDQERQVALDRMKQKYGLQWKMVNLFHRIQGKTDDTLLSIRPKTMA
ncbi:PPOX class F420-dependent oxidoreductase [Candidatus Bathyarchaeota archaeon]|nr:MAG: PPOX class F420-dependent oxidoreductase [Candidatus Bathyarchaeota archaeon]